MESELGVLGGLRNPGTGMVEFEDGLSTGVLPGAGTLVLTASNPGSIPKPPQVLHMSDIELQLFCGVRIELAVGFLPYPDMKEMDFRKCPSASTEQNHQTKLNQILFYYNCLILTNAIVRMLIEAFTQNFEWENVL